MIICNLSCSTLPYSVLDISILLHEIHSCRHSYEMIRHLEQAGLGYHIQAEETQDKLGRIPMRRLVYRVQPLPRSMLPLVWDFGQLSTEVEELYIRQMVLRHVCILENYDYTMIIITHQIYITIFNNLNNK